MMAAQEKEKEKEETVVAQRFVIKEAIGSGSFGAVHRAWDTSSKKVEEIRRKCECDFAWVLAADLPHLCL